MLGRISTIFQLLKLVWDLWKAFQAAQRESEIRRIEEEARKRAEAIERLKRAESESERDEATKEIANNSL